jgi:single-strand DNA-binding protein
MSDMNKILVLGRLGADPVSRETKTGSKMVTFRLATSRKFRDRSEHTEWFSVTSWGRDAERCLTYLSKGRSVLVEGSLQTHKYMGRDGVERMSLDIRADEITFLGGGRKLLSDANEASAGSSAEGELVESEVMEAEAGEAMEDREEIGAAELQAV